MYTLVGTELEATKDTLYAIILELTIMAYFFAMRSCKFTLTPQSGRTKIIRLRGVVFRDVNNVVIPHDDSANLPRAFRVTLTFEDQKNGTKNDRRTHQHTDDPVLCPVKCLVSLVQRILRTCSVVNPDTPINQICLISVPTQVSSTVLRQYISNAFASEEISIDRHRTFLQLKYKWKDQVWANIAWDAFAQCASRPALDKLVNRSKLVHNWLNLGSQRARHGTCPDASLESRCPYCSAAEDFTHLLTCTSPRA